MKKALIITVGNTADPILKAIKEEYKESGDITVFLLYGRPFPGQKNPSPFDIANKAKQECEEIGVAVRLFEAADPEDINASLSVARDIYRRAFDAEQVIVNFTGGTKVLSASVVHAALTEPLSGGLILDYTGGPQRDDQGRVIREAMRVVRSERTATDEILQEVINKIRLGNYRDAHLLSEHLPQKGKGGFVKRAAQALYLWDEFDYEAATENLQRLNEPAKVLSDDEYLSPLAAIIIKLLEPGNRICQLLSLLRKAQQGQIPSKSAIEHFPLLVADAIENSRRRLQEERATDSVLRSYRAVEITVQARLIHNGINPWRPMWQSVDQETIRQYLELLNATQPPRDIALSTGLVLLEVMGQTLSEEQQKWRGDLQQLRNYSYLEHGYQRLKVVDAQRLNNYATAICRELLGDTLNNLQTLLRHW